MKKLIPLVLVLCFMINTIASAGVLGIVSGGYSDDMGPGGFFYKTEFSGGNRGAQTEHYIEYTPNTDITPVIISGDKLWGSIDMYEANKYIVKNGLRSKGAINADFFSFKTGLSMGYVISDGEIITTVTDTLPAIGFRGDGSAFIDDINIKTMIYNGDESAEIAFINKWCQPGFDPIYLLTDYFGETTKTQSNCIYVIGEIRKGKLALDEQATLVVEEVFEYDGEIKIPKGKVVLLIDTAGGKQECMDFINGIQLGDELLIENECITTNGDVWRDAVEGCSTITPYLIKDNEVGSDFEAGVNPRTAAGITKEGKVILYTLDGRRNSYSAGATLDELAGRMKELGCVDAINFDGGGSTAIGAKLSNVQEFEIINKPSDGYPRKVSNYIFLRDNRLPTGIPKNIKYNNVVKHVYLGAEQKIKIDSVYDSAEYKIADYSVEINSDDAIVDGMNVKFNKPGTVNVSVDVGEYSDELIFEVYDKIDSFKVYDTTDWSEVESITLYKDTPYSKQLRAVPYADENELLLGEGVSWSVDESIGNVSETGYIALNTDELGSGNLVVELGGIKKNIPIRIVESLFYDVAEHWSKDKVNHLADENILMGIETDDGLAFFPDNNMTRVEFAAAVIRYLGINADEYSDNELNFEDSQNIPDWSKDIVKTITALGIMNGISNDDGKTFLFDASNTITRAEAITVLGRTIDYQSSEKRMYADDDIIPDWAINEVSKMVELKIIQGYSDNTLRPLNKVTRAEAVSMIYNAMNYNKKDMR